MQIPILDGIYTDNNSDFRTAYPVNLIPVSYTHLTLPTIYSV